MGGIVKGGFRSKSRLAKFLLICRKKVVIDKEKIDDLQKLLDSSVLLMILRRPLMRSSNR